MKKLLSHIPTCTILILMTIILAGAHSFSLYGQDIQGGATSKKKDEAKPTPSPASNRTTKKTNTSSKTNSPRPNRSSQPREDAKSVEVAFWESIKDSTNPADFRAYLNKYPNGEFSELARIRLAKLENIERKPNVSDTKTATIFEEHFNNNNRQWLENSDDATRHAVTDGYYLFESKKKDLWWFITQPVAINQDEDFKIECNARKIDGVNNYIYGLVWGVKDGDNFYYFGISGDGHFMVLKKQGGQFTTIIPWSIPNSINRGGSTNKLAIEKVGEQIKFFINDNFVGKAKFESLFGNGVGFIVYDVQKIAFDDLVISVKSR